jgi:hypothetical protein
MVSRMMSAWPACRAALAVGVRRASSSDNPDDLLHQGQALIVEELDETRSLGLRRHPGS